jgi:chromosome partitioning protein
MRVGIMQGSLQEFGLADVLQVVGLGRQYTGVELSLGGGNTGTIFVKSGQVVSAQANPHEGREAFHRLFRGAQGDFFVFRADTPQELHEPIGSLSTLLMDAEAERTAVGLPRTSSYAPAESGTTPGVAPPSPAPYVPVAMPLPPPPAAPPALELGKRPAAIDPPLSGAKVLAFASPKGGCGKSTVALNTALSLARRGHSVILVDADVNGDVLSAIDARERAKVGALDVVCGTARVQDALLDTVLPRFKLMPAVGPVLPDVDAVSSDVNARWQSLFEELGRRADIVVVDTPAGMFGTTRAVLRGVSHVVGVLQAEVLAARSFGRFTEGLASIPEQKRPQVVGVVLNMLQTRHHASLGVFQDALSGLPSSWLFDTTIPRHPAFLDATHEGVPLRQLDEDAPPPVAFLFDNLAGEIAERLGLRRAAKAQRLLL